MLLPVALSRVYPDVEPAGVAEGVDVVSTGPLPNKVSYARAPPKPKSDDSSRQQMMRIASD